MDKTKEKKVDIETKRNIEELLKKNHLLDEEESCVYVPERNGCNEPYFRANPLGSYY